MGPTMSVVSTPVLLLYTGDESDSNIPSLSPVLPLLFIGFIWFFNDTSLNLTVGADT